jgi:hypothetical protein
MRQPVRQQFAQPIMNDTKPTTTSASISPLATREQRETEVLALQIIEHPAVRRVRETSRALLLADPLAATPDGRLGLDRALDQWVLALAMRVANGDPFRPKIVWNVSPTPRWWFGHTFPGAAVAIDNPDNMNREVPIDGDSAYELTGRFGPDATQFTLVLEIEPARHAGMDRHLAALMGQQIQTEADGSFTVTIDAQPAAGRRNHLQSEKGRLSMFSRDSMGDWKQTPTPLAVRRVSGPAPPPPRSETELLQEVVDCLPAFVESWRGFKDTFLDYPEPNRLVGPNGRPGGWGFLVGGRFRIADDEAVVVNTSDGGANYTGFQIADPWTIAPDPIYRLSSLNKSQAAPNLDGGYTYVLSLRDPGLHNWIDTAGLHEGWMLLRWQGVPSSTDPATLARAVRVVKLAALASALPPGVPAIELQGRRAQMAARIADHARRIRWEPV